MAAAGPLVAVAVILICVASSTPQGRAEAAERFKRYNLPCAVFVVLAVLLLLACAPP